MSHNSIFPIYQLLFQFIYDTDLDWVLYLMLDLFKLKYFSRF